MEERIDFDKVLREEIHKFLNTDESLSSLIRRLRENYPEEFAQWLRDNPLREESRKMLNAVAASFLRGECE